MVAARQNCVRNFLVSKIIHYHVHLDTVSSCGATAERRAASGGFFVRFVDVDCPFYHNPTACLPSPAPPPCPTVMPIGFSMSFGTPRPRPPRPGTPVAVEQDDSLIAVDDDAWEKLTSREKVELQDSICNFAWDEYGQEHAEDCMGHSESDYEPIVPDLPPLLLRQDGEESLSASQEGVVDSLDCQCETMAAMRDPSMDAFLLVRYALSSIQNDIRSASIHLGSALRAAERNRHNLCANQRYRLDVLERILPQIAGVLSEYACTGYSSDMEVGYGE